MAGIILLAAIGVLITAYGLLMLVDPVLLTKTENSFFGWFQGKNRWFELSTHIYERRSARIEARVAGGILLWIGLYWLTSLARSVMQGGPHAPPPGEHNDHADGPPELGLAEKGIFMLLILAGIYLALWPGHASDMIGRNNHMKIAAPQWTWRAFGGVMILMGVMGILRI